jgi:hypothetical protein
MKTTKMRPCSEPSSAEVAAFVAKDRTPGFLDDLITRDARKATTPAPGLK